MTSRLTTPWILMVACLLAANVSHALSDPSPAAQALQARHGALKDELAQSPFRRPLLLRSKSSTSSSQGEIHAVMDHPFERLGTALQRPENWCALLSLQTNIKRCEALGAGSDRRLQVAVARRYTDRADEAHVVELRYALQTANENYLSVELAAAQGPVATRNYSLRIEAVPIGAGQSFVHLSYAYETGMAARWATNLYLATAGREKVGFSITGHDAQGQPLYVGGIQGVAERNTMRYFLAIESFLGSLSAPPAQRVERRLRDFHAALERYPAQLHETSLSEYLELKRAEAPG
jgi:hypothetical protein